MEMSTGICILRIQEGLDYADFFEPINKPTGNLEHIWNNLWAHPLPK